MHPLTYPFTAIVGQHDMKRVLMLHAVDPGLGGALIFGERGTGKSTAVRALARLLPPIDCVLECPYNCDPDRPETHCHLCSERIGQDVSLMRTQVLTPVVDLPLGATEDRILGSLDLELALAKGEKRFQPGLLARANRGFLYIDEVNLLADHLVDLLLDVSASGENVVERDGFSVRHPAHFVLVGSGNPEEGELRPQLLDRFALSVTVSTLTDRDERAEILRRRLDFSDDPDGFVLKWHDDEQALARQLLHARERLHRVRVPQAALELVAEIGVRANSDGHRAELAIVRAARAHAALNGHDEITPQDVEKTAPLALGHRTQDQNPSTARHIVDEVMKRHEPSIPN